MRVIVRARCWPISLRGIPGHGIELTATRRRTTGRPRRESQSRRKHEKAKRQGRTARREAPQSEREREWAARTLADLEALMAVRREKMERAGLEAPIGNSALGR